MANEDEVYEAKRGANIWFLVGMILFCILAMGIYLVWDFIQVDTLLVTTNFAPTKLGTMLIALLFAIIFGATYFLGKKIFPEDVKIGEDKIQIGNGIFLQDSITNLGNYLAKNETVRFVYEGKKYEFCFKYFDEKAKKSIQSFFAHVKISV